MPCSADEKTFTVQYTTCKQTFLFSSLLLSILSSCSSRTKSLYIDLTTKIKETVNKMLIKIIFNNLHQHEQTEHTTYINVIT